MAGPGSAEYSFQESPAATAVDNPAVIPSAMSSGPSDGSLDKDLLQSLDRALSDGDKAMPALTDRDAGSGSVRTSTPYGERGGGASCRRLPRGERERDRPRHLVQLSKSAGMLLPRARDLLPRHLDATDAVTA